MEGDILLSTALLCFMDKLRRAGAYDGGMRSRVPYVAIAHTGQMIHALQGSTYTNRRGSMTLSNSIHGGARRGNVVFKDLVSR